MKIFKILKSIFKKKKMTPKIELSKRIFSLAIDQKSIYDYLNDLIENISGYKVKKYICQVHRMPEYCMAKYEISFNAERDRFLRANFNIISHEIQSHYEKFILKFYKEYGWLLGRINWWIKIDMFHELKNEYPGKKSFCVQYLTNYYEFMLPEDIISKLKEEFNPNERVQCYHINLMEFNVIQDGLTIG